jgi:hypothetical protein
MQGPVDPTASYPPAAYPPANYPQANYPPANNPAQPYLPGQPGDPGLPPGYPPVQPNQNLGGYPGTNPAASPNAPPVAERAPARQPANELWAPEYQATPAPPPEPIAALNPPEATIRYGAARPLIRFGEVKPLVRYGGVQAIPDGQTEPAPAEEPVAATQEELEALFPPSARSTRRPGTGAWADVYLFRRASEFSSNLGPGLNVDWNSRADRGVVDPQMLDRTPNQPAGPVPPQGGRTAELESTIYRR